MRRFHTYSYVFLLFILLCGCDPAAVERDTTRNDSAKENDGPVTATQPVAVCTTGMVADLVRKGTVQLVGEKLGFRDQIALRAIFSASRFGATWKR